MKHEAETTGKSANHEQTPSQGELRPFDVAALATGLWIFHILRRQGEVGDCSPAPKPRDYLDAAYELLAEAKRVLARASEEEFANAARERRRAEDAYEPDNGYSLKEVLKVQTEAQPGGASESKFTPGKKWPRLESKFKSGEFRFTHKDLVSRPVGFSMVGTITTEKGLRNAIKRLFENEAEGIITSKMLSLYRINVILVDQLKRNRGKIPAPRETKTRPT
jgi:hypothetical protein